MKKRRTNNPRFLAALGFLGFMGFLGSQNPEVMRWAKLSWLSLFSLLVWFPTMDVESQWADRILPRRRWMLAFLAGLGFLSFLHTDNPGIAFLAMLLSMPAQFSIDHKKKTAMPTKELRHIFALLFLAVVLPLGGMVWFMTAAVRNEQMAVKQRLTEVYESQLDGAFREVKESIEQQRVALSQHGNLASAERFYALVLESIADSILVLDESGNPAYPANPKSEYNVSVEGEAIQHEVRNLVRTGAVSNACERVGQMAADETLRNARDESGRMILPALQLFCLQSEKETSPTVLNSLLQTVTDYKTQMPSARRLFFMQSLTELGVDVEPWLSAETLAAELEDVVLPSNENGYRPVPGKPLFLLFGEDKQTVGVFDGSALIQHLQGTIDSFSRVEGVRIKLEYGQPQAWQSLPLPMLSDNWFLALHVGGDDPFSDTADRRIVRYVWIGNMVIVGMAFVFVLLVRSLLAQQRLTKMKNDFVATVTHELKTPLASTRMLVDTLLEGRCRSDGQQREYLELIARENKRLSRLIDNFLTFSRMERNKRSFSFEDVAPGDIAKTAVETVHENYEQCGCKLSVEVAEKLPMIVADRDSMVQVLLNLLDNACKYSNGDKQIELKVFTKAQSVCFEVNDNGIGMAKRELSKIMDRFYQVDQSMTRNVGGAGLGLSIVSFIVDAHGGTIDIESELGKGSVFTVEIPAIDAAV